jgi:hypothetical protein
MVKKVKNIEVKSNSFGYSIEQYKNDFLYLELPYFLDGYSETFVGIYPHSNSSTHHNGFKHKLLNELLSVDIKVPLFYHIMDCAVDREMCKGNAAAVLANIQFS